MLDVKQIKPKGNKSDKYSIQLYHFLLRIEERRCDKVYYQAMHPVQVGCDENHEPINEYQEVPFNINNFNIGDIYLSYQQENYINERNEITGVSLQSVLGDRKNKYEMFCYVCGYAPRKYIDISDVFWNEYIKHGRCIWDRQHTGWLKDDEGRFTYLDEDNRRCNWCGAEQHKEIKTVTKTQEIWI